MNTYKVNPEALEALHDVYKVVTQINSIHVQQTGLESIRDHYYLQPKELMRSILPFTRTHEPISNSPMLVIRGEYPDTMVGM